MEINWFIVFMLTCISFLVMQIKKFRYIDAFLFFIPFNATVVLFLPNGTALNLPFCLFILSSISFFLKIIFSRKILIPKQKTIIYFFLIVISCLVIISQIMPYIIDGTYQVLNRYSGLPVVSSKNILIYPSMQWVTQTLYFLIGILVVFIVSFTYRSGKEVVRALKLIISGVSFMVFWGWFGCSLFYMNIPLPTVFNHVGMWGNGIVNTYNGYPRMASVTFEPSYFAQILIPIIPFFYWFYKSNESLFFSKKFFKYIYIISLISLVIAITSTGILGFFMLIGLLLINNFSFFSLRTKYILVVFYSLLVIVSTIFTIQYIIDLSETFSGVERFKTVVYGIEYFIDYPILGLGWGVFPTHDFFINLLVNIGLLGTISFLILLYYVLKKLLIKQKSVTHDKKYIFRAAIESFILLMIVSQLSGFVYHSQYFWLYLGLYISISSLELKKGKIKNEILYYYSNLK